MNEVRLEISDKFEEAIDRICYQGLARTSFRIMTDASQSILVTTKSSQPGQTPHSRHGKLPQSIAYAVTSQQSTIGPRFSMINLIGNTMEFGGEFRKRNYLPRPFMGPALKRNLGFFAASFGGSTS